MPSLLQTTIAGSLPKPAWLAEPNALWAPWKLEGEALAHGKRDAVRLAIFDQERAGIDIVTDGEQTRRHFVTTFIEGLDGVDWEHKRTVRIRDRYDAAVPVVVGPVARREPIYVDDAAFLRHESDRRVKYTLPGPMTMVDTLYDDHYRSREKLAFAFAEILNAEARAIEAAGADVIQFDEPAFNVYFDEVRDWGIAALERAAAGLQCTTAVHICYGYGIKANVEWKKTLGREWRQYEQTFPRLARSTIGQVSLECANSRVPIELIGLLEGKDVLVGAIDVASEQIETAADVARVIRSALAYVKAERLFPCTNCGMVPLSPRSGEGEASGAGCGRRPRPGRARPLILPSDRNDRSVWDFWNLPPATSGSDWPFIAKPRIVPACVLFQAVKHALYDRLLSRSTAVLSLRSKHRSGNVPFYSRT
jgi:5-methyltetrahydropteroyltriglutamate--homocysteine methyltransferase